MANRLFEIRTLDGRPPSLIAREVVGVFKQLMAKDGRLTAVRREVVRQLTERVYADVQRTLKPHDELRDYAGALRLVQVKGLPAKETQYAITSGKPVRSAAVPQTAVFVYPRGNKRPEARPKYVSVLAEYNPWTTDTLPVAPSDKDAKVVLRVMSKQEMARVRDQRRADLPTVRKKLADLGVKLTRRSEDPIHGVQDLGFLALRVEFGQGGQKHLPHWRPAIRTGFEWAARDWTSGQWWRWLWDPSFTKWKTRPQRYEEILSQRARQFGEFTNKIRI